MLRKASEPVPEANGLVPQKEEFGSGQPTWGHVYRIMNEAFYRCRKKLDEILDEVRKMDQHVTYIEHGARQPHFAMEANGPANTKTQERTEGAATAVQAMRGESCTTAQRVQDGPMTSITFGVVAKPTDLPCRDDVLVEGGDATPRSCLPSLEMRSPTAAGGLVLTGEVSTATETISNERLFRFYATEETNPKEKKSWTSIPSVSCDSSVFQKRNLSTTPYKVVETKSKQNKTFDPGSSRGQLRPCPFLGS